MATEYLAQIEAEGVKVSIDLSAGSDGALVVWIDTEFEPGGSDGGPGLRVQINDDDAYIGVAYIDDDTYIGVAHIARDDETPLNDSQRLGLEHYDFDCDFLNGRDSAACTCDPKWEPTLDDTETDALLQGVTPNFRYEALPGWETKDDDLSGQWAPGFYTLTDGRKLYVNIYGSSCFTEDSPLRGVEVGDCAPWECRGDWHGPHCRATETPDA